MMIDRLSLPESQSIDDRAIVRVALGQISMTSREMRGHEAEAGVVVIQPDSNGTLVARHASEAGLETGVSDVFLFSGK